MNNNQNTCKNPSLNWIFVLPAAILAAVATLYLGYFVLIVLFPKFFTFGEFIIEYFFRVALYCGIAGYVFASTAIQVAPTAKRLVGIIFCALSIIVGPLILPQHLSQKGGKFLPKILSDRIAKMFFGPDDYKKLPVPTQDAFVLPKPLQEGRKTMLFSCAFITLGSIVATVKVYNGTLNPIFEDK